MQWKTNRWLLTVFQIVKAQTAEFISIKQDTRRWWGGDSAMCPELNRSPKLIRCRCLARWPTLAAMFFPNVTCLETNWVKKSCHYSWLGKRICKAVKRGSCPTRGLILETCSKGELIKFDRIELTFKRRRHHDGNALKHTASRGEKNDS